jgi:hypothetical protein
MSSLRFIRSIGNLVTDDWSSVIAPITRSITLTGHGYHWSSLAEINGQMSLLYPYGGKWYYKTSTGDGTSESDWSSGLGTDVPIPYDAIAPKLYDSVNGPAVVYTETNASNSIISIKFIYASNFSASSWSSIGTIDSMSYNGVDVVEPSNVIKHTGGTFGFSAYDTDAGTLKYYKSSTANGTAWAAGVDISLPSTSVSMYTTATRTSVFLVQSNPAIASVVDVGGGGKLLFARASNADGSSWATDAIILDNTDVDLDIPQHPSLRESDSLACIAYRGSYPESHPMFIRATAVNGGTWGDDPVIIWQENPDQSINSEVSLQSNSTGSKPTVLFYDFNANLRLSVATSMEGTRWVEPIVIGEGDNYNVRNHWSILTSDSDSSFAFLTASSAEAVDSSGSTDERLAALAGMCYFDVPTIDVYEPKYGGQWYYSQNKPGTSWFDNVSNERGWTVDFNLEVLKIENSDGFTDTDPPDGLGIYVNDGYRQEILYFLEQEIVFKNSNIKVTYDTTQATQYRLTGKQDELKLYARRDNELLWGLIANVSFLTEAANAGHARKPGICTDDSGNIHAVWYDDGNVTGQLYYSKYDGASWSVPEMVVSTSFGAQFPEVVVDSENNIYIAYETKEAGYTEISFLKRNDMAWGEPVRLSYGVFESTRPRLSVDTEDNIHMVWEDHRYGHPEIFYARWNSKNLSFEDEQRITDTLYGSFRPSICSYFNDIYVSYTIAEPNDVRSIHLIAYSQSLGSWGSEVEVNDSSTSSRSDYSDVLCSIGGKIFITWHDDVFANNFDIYARILNPRLDFLTDVIKVTSTFDDSKFPVVSQQQETGNIYICWHDTRSSSSDFDSNPYASPYSFDPYADYSVPNIYVAFYDNLANQWFSSGQGAFDTHLDPLDDRSMTFPAIPKSFSGSLHVLYESEMARSESHFLPSNELFSEVRDAVYDLSYVQVYPLLLEPYGVDRDLLVSTTLLRKEIRFGDFSNTLGSKIKFRNFGYYLNDAVGPFELKDVSNLSYPIDEIRVYDSVVNDHGDVWWATACGVYFYFNETRSLSTINDTEVANKNVRCISFNNNNVLFIGIGTDILYSFDHVNFTALSLSLSSNATSVKFTESNKMVVGTESNGAIIYGISESPLEPNPATDSNTNQDLTTIVLVAVQEDTFATGEKVSNIATDENEVIWVATYGGLYRYLNGHTNHITTTNGLPTNRINDIAIRNTAIRYVATASGLCKMVGLSCELVTSEDSNIWNNNVKSVLWQEPNIIWAGTLSNVNQIFEKADGSFTTTVYEPSDIMLSDTKLDDHSVFYILADDGTDIPANAQVEVYLNGYRITQGYTVSLSNESVRALKFETDLLHSDVISVVIRTDISLLSSFSQSDEEKKQLGSNIIRVKSIQAESDGIYIATEGDENEIKLNDAQSVVPYDCVHLDTTLPVGCIDIVEQIDSSTVRVQITDVDDGTSGSGVDEMIISNYSNFTTDGSTSQSSIPFATTAAHDLGTILGESSVSQEFSSGTGSVIEFFDDGDELYSATSKPAVIYKMDNAAGTWSQVLAFASDEYVDFIEKYNNKFIVGVGHDTNPGKVYSYVDDGSFVDPIIRTTTGSRLYDAQEVLGTLYIATGDDGKVYSYDGENLSTMFTGLASNVYSLATANNVLFAGTGESGRIYRLDPSAPASLIGHQDSDTAISAMGVATIDKKDVVFAGTVSEGKILRTFAEEDSYNRSFKTIDSKVSDMAQNSAGTALYAAVGQNVYSVSSTTAAWSWEAGADESINSITVFDSTIYFLTDTKVYKVATADEYKTVYLKLIDKAGNESDLFDSHGALIDCRFDTIEISDLQGFVSENRLLELDSSGNIVYSLAGSDKYYAGQEIEQEEGIYDSQIFNGSNELIKWDSIRWFGVEPSGTDILMYIRAGATESDILTEDWVGPYTIGQSTGVDTGFLSGQFFQFKVILRSRQKGISPSLSRVIVRSIATGSTHFFTTNFALPSRMTKGILTSEKITPVAADIVFGVNTTDSVDWSDYQIIDENRLFNITQFGENMRVGIKLISPSRLLVPESDFDEYGPYSSSLYVNTVDTMFENEGATSVFDFRVSFYSDVELTQQVYSAFTANSADNFSIDGEDFPAAGKTILAGADARLLFSPPGEANLHCNTFYFVKIEAYNQSTGAFLIVDDNNTFIAGCSASFIDTIVFDFMNSTGSNNNFHFRVRFYSDGERTDLFSTEFSGNDRTGWTAGGGAMPESGVTINDGETTAISFSPDLDAFDTNTLYYLTIDAYNGSDFLLASNSYTFNANDITSLSYCGPYRDVPIVKNFAMMFEMLNNQLVTLNLGL